MKFKFIITLVILTLLVGVSSCETDPVVDEAEFSDIAFITSEFRNTTFTVNVNDFLTFNDISVNAVEHAWTIEEGSVFLEGPIGRNDTILEPFIIPDMGLVSEEKTINVLFQKGGLTTVNLRNAFNDSVSLRTSNGDIPSRREGNLFVFDTTFVVDVYDTIVPIIDIRQNGVSVPFELETDTITIEAGDFLEFVDLSVKDRVTSRIWRIDDNGSVTDSVAMFQFNKLGVFNGVADLSRGGDNIPADFERYEIPGAFKVIPSSQPFVVAGDVIELEDETIQIPFNGEFAPFGGQEEFFTVMLNNGDGPRELDISSVTRNSSDATLLEIKLAEPIYRPDDITISYAGGTLLSTDTRSPVEFSDLPVVMHNVSAIPAEFANIFDFEGAAAELNWSENGDSESDGIEITNERASSGTTSLKYTISASAASPRFFIRSAQTLTLPTADYVVNFDVFIEEGSTINEIWPTFENGFFQQWRDGRAAAVPRGQWVTITTTADLGEFNNRTPLIRIQGNPATVYIDNYKIITKEERP